MDIEKGLMDSSIPLLFPYNNVDKKRLGVKTKIKLDFLKIFDDTLSKYFVYKNVS